MKAPTLPKTDLKSRKQRIRLCLLVSVGILLILGTVWFVAPFGSVGHVGAHLDYGKIPRPSPAFSKGLMHVAAWKTGTGVGCGATSKIKGSVWAVELHIDTHD